MILWFLATSERDEGIWVVSGRRKQNVRLTKMSKFDILRKFAKYLSKFAEHSKRLKMRRLALEEKEQRVVD